MSRGPWWPPPIACLFCNNDLGHNEAVEHFPVGRRLAFDAAKGRLWVVCRKCERWNLTPLEERWEAIEECERAFRGTKLRVSTDEIGLAKLREGLELVRIGDRTTRDGGVALRRSVRAAPQTEVSHRWWRRGRGGHVVVAGPVLGIVGAGALSPMTNLITTGSNSIARGRPSSFPVGGRSPGLASPRLQADSRLSPT